MHPNRAFRFADDAAMLAFAGARGFAHIFASTSEGPMVAHAPITPVGDAFRFHVARANPVARHLDGATGVFVAQILSATVFPGERRSPVTLAKLTARRVHRQNARFWAPAFAGEGHGE